MNKTDQRKKAKLHIIAGLIVDSEIINQKQREAIGFAEKLSLFHSAVALRAMAYRIQSVNWGTLTPDGKVDKRRHRRYVTKHKREYKIKPNVVKFTPPIDVTVI